MWILQSADPDLTFSIRPGAVKAIGRAGGAQLILDAPLVSRVHCRIEAGDERLEVVDLNSTNGTFVNDTRVERAWLLDGDRLRVGQVELIVGKADGV